MKTRSFPVRLLMALTAWGLVVSGLVPARAEGTNAGPQILFVRLKFAADESLKVMETTARPGELKPPLHAETTEGLHYELLDAAGKSLWHAAIPDPREASAVQAEARDGKWTAPRVAQRAAEFMVRVPVRTNAAQLEFYRLAIVATNQPPERVRLGLFPLPLP